MCIQRMCRVISTFVFAALFPFLCKAQPDKATSSAVMGFIDSMHLGKVKGRYMVQVAFFKAAATGEQEQARIVLLKKKGTEWMPLQIIDSAGISGSSAAIKTIPPQFDDINSDGLPDLWLFAGMGANLANGYWMVYLFDKRTERLCHLKGSEQVSNLLVSKRTRLIHGSGWSDETYYHNYKIENDSLAESGGIRVWREAGPEKDKYGTPILKYEHHDKYIIQANGETKVIRRQRVKAGRKDLYKDPEEEDALGW